MPKYKTVNHVIWFVYKLTAGVVAGAKNSLGGKVWNFFKRCEGAMNLGNKCLVALGLDSDGHVRITRGDGFCLYGGSESTHEKMQHKFMLLDQALGNLERSMCELDEEEISELADACGMSLVSVRQKTV